MSKWNESDLRPSQNAVAICLMDNKNRILVMDHVKLNKWAVPVGKVDDGDTIEETFVKELYEELGITMLSSMYLGNYDKTYARDDVSISVTTHVVVCTNYKGKIVNNEPDKHRSLRWISYKDIDKIGDVSDATKFVFDRLTIY